MQNGATFEVIHVEDFPLNTSALEYCLSFCSSWFILYIVSLLLHWHRNKTDQALHDSITPWVDTSYNTEFPQTIQNVGALGIKIYEWSTFHMFSLRTCTFLSTQPTKSLTFHNHCIQTCPVPTLDITIHSFFLSVLKNNIYISRDIKECCSRWNSTLGSLLDQEIKATFFKTILLTTISLESIWS